MTKININFKEGSKLHSSLRCEMLVAVQSYIFRNKQISNSPQLGKKQNLINQLIALLIIFTSDNAF